MELNREQREAAEHVHGPMLVLAGPGSGKTHTITARIVRLIKKSGVAPEKILVITFSKAAAVEMKQRFVSQAESAAKVIQAEEKSKAGQQESASRGVTEEKSCQSARAVNFGTFHAVFFKILKGVYGYSAADIVSEHDKFLYIRDAVYSTKADIDKSQETLDSFISAISLLKTEGITPKTHLTKGEYERTARMLAKVTQSITLDILLSIYANYQGRLQEEKKLDFDDMMIKCEEIFETRKDVLEYWQERFEYILIDEFQDINNVQYKLVKLLAQPQNNIFAVGDDDQSIYGFRGASPELMLQFTKDFKNCRIVRLDTNYRSLKAITDAASRLIANNSKRFDKIIRSGRGEGGSLQICHFEHFDEESQFVIKYLQELKETGGKAGECAVLYRINSEARVLQRQLMEASIPFRIKEKLPDIAGHWIAKDITCYLDIAAGSRKRADFLRICNRPLRYVSRDSFSGTDMDIDDLIENNREKPYVVKSLIKLKHDITILQKFDMYASVRYIRLAIGYDAYIREYAKKHNRDDMELFEILAELEEIARQCSNVEDWHSVLEKTDGETGKNLSEKGIQSKLCKEVTNVLRHGEAVQTGGSAGVGESLQNGEQVRSRRNVKNGEVFKNSDCVELMSFHCSKGLEFKTVFILDASEGLTPQGRAEDADAIEEERRAFYVAMTRAKDNLFILESKERLGRTMTPSRFLSELQDKHCRKQ